MPALRISSPRSILTAAFYRDCSAHPRCWARTTEHHLPLNPSSCSFLKWKINAFVPPSSSLQYFSLPQESSPSSSLLSWCLPMRHRNAQSFQSCSSPFQRGHSYNAAAKRRELLNPFLKGSLLGWVKASVYHPPRLMKNRVRCPEQPEPPSDVTETSCTLLVGSYENTGGQDTLG